MSSGELDKTVADGCLVFIVGPNHFQNSLFAAYFETNSRWESIVVDKFPPISAESKKLFPRQTAVLFDCFGLSGAALYESVLMEMEQLPPDWPLVLFNLDRHAGIEKKALEYGVHGFFYQDDPIETFLKGLAAVFGGEFWVSRRKMADVILENGFRIRRKQITNHDYPHDLTRREVELLGFLTLGASNDVIADKLCISPHTVRTHFNNIYRKIKVTNRLEASIWAFETLFSHKHN